jgi:phosphate:Na+ symporter
MWTFNLIGSLGLFLLGMWLMTEGLKQAGGRALQSLLGSWTSNRLRGLSAGILVTALVQSSSAVTVATIGFVNAGLMTFQQSVWVIFGSNVGTTMTGWLVTVFGFSLDIEAFTFPLLGVGAFLRVFSPNKRGQALGMAMAGFGLLFMGIDALQSTFTSFAAQFDMRALSTAGVQGVVLGVFIGMLLTIATQSSSAAIALILTAVAGGIAGLTVAAAAVIGANIGTTSTALIATLGATSNAKRLAFAHVLFNVITASVALLLLPLFLGVTAFMSTPGRSVNTTMALALFHTSFNVLGVILMQPLEPWMSRYLLGLFRKISAETHSPSVLDKNVAAVPDLAIRALSLELHKLREQLTLIPLHKLLDSADEKLPDRNALDARLDGVDQFIQLVSQADLSKELSNLLAANFQ